MTHGKSIEGRRPRDGSAPWFRSFCTLLVATTLYDAPASGAAELQDAVTFRGGVDLVTATVSVRDRKGRVIRDLKQTDFEIIDSGVSREIRTFESGESPISLAVLVDISGSMSVGGNMERARNRGQRRHGGVAVRADEAALFTFDSKLQEIVGLHVGSRKSAARRT